MRLNDVEVNNPTDCRPIDTSSVVIRTIEVLWNPFDDIVPRNVVSQKSMKPVIIQTVAKSSVAIKDKKLLSFDDEEEEEEEENIESVKFGMAQKKMHSSHSSSIKPIDSKLVDIPAYECIANVEDARITDNDVPTKKMKSINNSDPIKKEEVVEKVNKATPNPTNVTKESLKETNFSNKSISVVETEDVVNEYQQMKNELLRSQRAIRVITGEEAQANDKETAFHDMTSLVEQRRLKYLKRKKTHGDRENETLAKLQSFKSKLSKTKEDSNELVEELSEGNVDKDEDENDDNGGYKGKLKFVHHPDDKYRNA